MSRLTDKLLQAGGAAQRQSAKIEARADAIIARESALEHKTDQAFSPHEAILSEAETGLDALEQQLAVLTNGGPPLEPSTPSPADLGPIGVIVEQPSPQPQAPQSAIKAAPMEFHG